MKKITIYTLWTRYELRAYNLFYLVVCVYQKCYLHFSKNQKYFMNDKIIKNPSN